MSRRLLDTIVRRRRGRALGPLAAVLLAATALPAEAADAPETDHWSFQPVRRPSPPKMSRAWAETPIDGFVLARLDAAGLEPSPTAPRRDLIRRIYYDMLGLPPTPRQVDRFVHDDRPGAWQRLVDRVLASPHYGERWARHWLDVVGYAETHGYEKNQPRPHAYRYRDWVIRSLNADKRYDRFLFEQLAGDAVGADAATGFLVAGPHDEVQSADPELTAQQRQNDLDDMVSTTGMAMLGLTLGCARCPDHKFDPIIQKDYYALQAVFAGVHHGNRPIERSASRDRRQRAKAIGREIDRVKRALARFQPLATTRETIVLDDERTVEKAGDAGVALLAEPKGHGKNAPGSERGRRDDPGGPSRLPNVSGGRYTWWADRAGEALLAYVPRAAGRYRIWLTWGCGWDTHTTAAEYLLDRDGDPNTKDDRRPLATVNQRYFADGTGEVPGKPLWSGFYDAGVHRLRKTSRILLRSRDGDTITADTIVLQAPRKGGSPPETPRLRPPVRATRNVARFEPVVADAVRFTIRSTNSDTEPCLDELEIFGTDGKNVARASAGAVPRSSGDYSGSPKHKLEHVHDGRYGNAHSWISATPSGGWVSIRLEAPTEIDRVVWSRDREGDYDDRLPTAYRIAVRRSGGEWRTVAASTDRLPSGLLGSAGEHRFASLGAEEVEKRTHLVKKLAALVRKQEALTTRPKAYAGQFKQPEPTHLLYRGDPMAKRELVAPDALSVLEDSVGSLDLDVDAPEQARRVALAKWITDRDNPLTARVIVNRLWHYHFGTGLVDTPSDFGANGSRPTHPRLLDWLASELIRSGWSLKHIHRLILTSATYRQASTPRPRARKRDGATRLLWRYPPRRLEAEAIRDTVLAVSGSLRRRMYGPGYRLFKPNDNYVRVYRPKEKWGPAQWRRMVYRHQVRMETGPVFGAFDCPTGGRPQPDRSASTTPIQALNLLNSGFMVQQAERFASRLKREAEGSAADRVRRGFRLAYGRTPTAEERRASVRVAKNHGLRAFCRALLNSNELLFIP